MSRPTRFTQTDAVEAWDAEFRWRAAGKLRDVTIDDTWWRVADHAASAEGIEAGLWSHRFVDAFARWRLLPEERILRSAGTDTALDVPAVPAAVLNAAAFVVKTPGAGTYFDRDRFVATAALAVRFLDDVAGAAGMQPPPSRLRIGLIGLADALKALELSYSLTDGRYQAAQFARALAEGCLRGSIDLAEERGPRIAPETCRARIDCLRRRQMPDWLVERALRIGMYHESLTAIHSHPFLARLANGVADAIDPLAPDACDAGSADCGQTYTTELEMRAEIQRWIDEPISYALRIPASEVASSPVDDSGRGEQSAAPIPSDREED